MSISVLLWREDKFLSRSEFREQPWPKWAAEPNLLILILSGVWKFWILCEAYVAWFVMHRGAFPSRFLTLRCLKRHSQQVVEEACRRCNQVHDKNQGMRPHEVCQGLGGKEEVKVYLSHPFLLLFTFHNLSWFISCSLCSGIPAATN